MKRMMGKIIALLLCLSLCASYVPLAAADDIASGTWGSLSWTLDNNGLLVISGSGAMKSGKYPWKGYKDQIINIVISDGITNIANMAFGGHDPGGINEACSFLESVTIPASVTSIGFGAFWDCSNLISVNIPSGVTNIGAAAFSECSSLTTVLIPASVNLIEERVFEGCSSLTRINVDEANQTYCDQDGVLFNKSGSKIVSFPGGRGGDYNIPSNVEAIEDYAFSGCVRLTGVTIPSGVTEISVAAFKGCNSLAKVRIPDSVTKIDNFAFLGCSELSTITIPLNVKTIGNQAFQGCGLTDITIPSGVTSIGIGSFGHCSGLTSISIPLSMRRIGSSAFDGCSALTDVYFEGKDEEWDTISIEAGNDMLTSANIHYETGNSNDDPIIDIGSGISVFESLGDPEISSFRFYQDVNGTDFIDLTDSTENLIVNYEGSTDPYKFEIEVNDPDLVSHVYITANASDGVRQMEAVYDPNSGNFIAEGFFDEENIFYQPESIKLEYTPVSDTIAVGSQINWEETIPYIGSLVGSEIISAKEGDTYAGIIDFSETVQDIQDLGLKYAIRIIDKSNGTEVGKVRAAYDTGMNVLSYVVPGLDDSRYVANVDMDGWTFKMLLDDEMDVASKLIEVQMEFTDMKNQFPDAFNPSNINWGERYVSLSDASQALSNISTVSKVIGKAHKINMETEELRQQIEESTTIRDKVEANRKVDELHDDKMGFMLLTTALPLIVAGGAVTGAGAPVLLFGAIIGVMSAASNAVYDYRVAGILGCSEVNTIWYDNISREEGQCGDRAHYRYIEYYGTYYWDKWRYYWARDLLDSELYIYGSGSTYDAWYIDGESISLPDDGESISLPDARKVFIKGISRIGNGTFANMSKIEEITLSGTINEIGRGAFGGCNSLDNVYIPSSVIKICNEAFADCDNLKTIRISNGVRIIGENAFSGCYSLESISVPDSVTDIERSAFYDCSALKQIRLGSGIKNIGCSAFGNCESLINIDLPDGLETIGSDAFKGSGITELSIPSSFKEIVSKNPLTIITDDSGVTHIYGDEPRIGSGLKKIIFREGITSIPDYFASHSVDLTEVQIPDTVTTIGNFAFVGCTSLTEIDLPDNLITVGNSAFSGAPLRSIDLPDSLKTIGAGAFTDAEFHVVRIPKSVESIDWGAFSYKTDVSNVDDDARRLTVYFEGNRGDFTKFKELLFEGRIVEAYYPQYLSSWNYRPYYGAMSITWHAYGPEGVDKLANALSSMEGSEGRYNLSSETVIGDGDTLTVPPFVQLYVYAPLTVESGGALLNASDIYLMPGGSLTVQSGGSLTMSDKYYEDSGILWSASVNLLGGTFNMNGNVNYADKSTVFIYAENYGNVTEALTAVNGIADSRIYAYVTVRSSQEMFGGGESYGYWERMKKYGYVSFCLDNGLNLDLPVDTIPQQYNLFITDGTSIKIPVGNNLDLEGTLYLEGGTLENNGTLNLNGSILYESSNSSIINYGVMNVYGRLGTYAYFEDAPTGTVENYGIITAHNDGMIEPEITVVNRNSILNCPASLTEVQEEAFVGTAGQEIDLPEHIEIIGSRAFADSDSLCLVVIPNASVVIEPDAFQNSGNVCIAAPTGGSVEQFASQNDIPFISLG